MELVSIVLSDINQIENAINKRLRELQDKGYAIVNVSRPAQFVGEKNDDGSDVIMSVIMYETGKDRRDKK